MSQNRVINYGHYAAIEMGKDLQGLTRMGKGMFSPPGTVQSTSRQPSGQGYPHHMGPVGET